MTNNYSLSNEQIEFVINEWSKEYQHHGDECLCGYYECYVEDIGYLIIETHCRKSNSCPNGMSWVVDNDIQVWSEGLSMWGYVPNSYELEGESLKLLGYISREQVNEMREVVRKSIIRDYSPWGYDEYGNDPNDYMGEDENISYTLKEIKETFEKLGQNGEDALNVLKNRQKLT